jgi:hypothetical protein
VVREADMSGMEREVGSEGASYVFSSSLVEVERGL